MKAPRALFALGLALCSALPFAGCTEYCSVTVKRPHGPADTANGKIIAQELRRNSRHPEAALACCLDGAAAAERQLRSKPGDARARAGYNFAVARIFEIIHDAKLEPWKTPVRVPGREGGWLLSFPAGGQAGQDPAKCPMLPADRYEFRGTYVKTRTLKEGLGAPLVVTGKEQDFTKADRIAKGKLVHYGMTGLLRFDGRKCVLSTADPLATERVRLGGHSHPLAADFTAPLALALAQEKLTLFGIRRQLSPQTYADTARIARLQPYDAAKIPVIWVHGLLDSPTTWVPVINALRGDAEIRRRYQFWFYSYPSGYPYPHSAAIMRQQLDAMNARYPDHKKEVLIGHSMGGLISRAMITDSGMKLWNACFQQPQEQVGIPAQAHETLGQALIFQHRPEVGRVIFISTPHRGSDVAAGWMSRIGSRIVRAPGLLLGVSGQARSLHTLDDGTPGFRLLPYSVETMSPENQFVKTINTIPTTAGVPCHSIMGDRGKGGNKDQMKPVSTDGFVPYWSSHFDEAKSELVVPSKHSAHQNAQAIEEVRRILRENGRQADRRD